MIAFGIASVFKAVLGICETDPLDPALWSIEGGTVTVKVGEVTQLADKDSAVYLRGQGLSAPVLIVNTGDNRFLAFQNRCTHMRRKLDPVPGQDRLRCCSISHSTFDLEGNALSGLARNPLNRYETQLKDGNLLITL